MQEADNHRSVLDEESAYRPYGLTTIIVAQSNGQSRSLSPCSRPTCRKTPLAC